MLCYGLECSVVVGSVLLCVLCFGMLSFLWLCGGMMWYFFWLFGGILCGVWFGVVWYGGL